jgi:hypothetical protein
VLRPPRAKIRQASGKEEPRPSAGANAQPRISLDPKISHSRLDYVGAPRAEFYALRRSYVK